MRPYANETYQTHRKEAFCRLCGAAFRPKTKWAEYCCDAHRQEYWRGKRVLIDTDDGAEVAKLVGLMDALPDDHPMVEAMRRMVERRKSRRRRHRAAAI